MQQKVDKISERHAKYVIQSEKIEKKLGIETNTAKCNELWKKKYQ